MSYSIAPALRAILDDADRVAPGRSHASDGTIGDATHAASVSDHNPAPGTGIVHAVDVTNDPGHGMDTWVWAQRIAERMKAGVETRVKYLVSNNGQHDVIFNPSVSMTWRLNNAEGGQSHRNHLHTSILYTARAENDTSPYFVGGVDPAPPPPPPPPPLKENAVLSVFYSPIQQRHRVYVPRAGKLQGHVCHTWTPLTNGFQGFEDLSAVLGLAGHEVFDPDSVDVCVDETDLSLAITALAADGACFRFWFGPGTNGKWRVSVAGR